MHFSNKQRQCTRRLGCGGAKPHSRQPPAAAQRIRSLSKHSSGNPRCTNASKPLLASHRENLGPGKEEHILALARVQGLSQSIPPHTDHGGALGMTLQTCKRPTAVPKAVLGPVRNPTSSSWAQHCPRGPQ